MKSLLRRSVAEAFGTFGLIFIGAGSVIANSYPGANFGLLGIALAHALVFSVVVTATMNISGGHINPAVTVGLLVARRVDGKTAGVYIAAQLLGAVIGALALKFAFPVHLARTAAYGTPLIHTSVTGGQAVLMEAILTFFLVSAVFGTAVSPDAPKVGGFGIGLVLLFGILVGGPLTGAAMNPARAFGPSVASGIWTGHYVYWVGPLLGGIVAGVLWDRLLLPKHTPAGGQK